MFAIPLSRPYLSITVDMLSDQSCGTLSFDMPILPPSISHPEEDHLAPLNFDELLDLAREFEFTRTISHIWPCEEEQGTWRLDDILAAMVPTPNADDSPLPRPSSVSGCPAPVANAGISTRPVPPPKGDDQVRAETGPPIVSVLRGWSPPNGSQFLDLDDSLMLPRSAISEMQPQTWATAPKPLPESPIDKAIDDPRKRNTPTPVQPSTRTMLESVRDRPAVQTSSNVTAATSHANTPKSRSHMPSIPATGGISTANHARAPRGGIPPYIARSVTKANILRVEEERKVMQDAFSSTTTGEAKKPSVLRRVAKVERETSKSANGGGNGKKPFDWAENEKEGRAVKRVKV
ncbi:hypothetical protein HD554DRAFT_237986 [Boletus coccyginus]|nr:hypothetical protein HD554DRAFT_237986 [Boletus coccyginus]